MKRTLLLMRSRSASAACRGYGEAAAGAHCRHRQQISTHGCCCAPPPTPGSHRCVRFTRTLYPPAAAQRAAWCKTAGAGRRTPAGRVGGWRRVSPGNINSTGAPAWASCAPQLISHEISHKNITEPSREPNPALSSSACSGLAPCLQDVLGGGVLLDHTVGVEQHHVAWQGRRGRADGVTSCQLLPARSLCVACWAGLP